MGKDNGFREFDRKNIKYDPIDKRVRNFEEFLIPLADGEVENQGARCMDCGTPFCHPNCPLHNIMPDFNDLVYKGKWEEAYESLRSTNNFPEFTGKICPAPCESGCVLGLISDPVSIKNIELSIVENAYQKGLVKPRPPKSRSGKSVAVVGSGPAGLAAADQLNQAGHAVTVYERANKVGGLLRYGIPDFKISKKIIDRRVKIMQAEGINFVTDAAIGEEGGISAKQLQGQCDAVVLTGGSTVPRDLPIDGRDAKGVHFAMDFLRQSNKRVSGEGFTEEELLATGKNVLVIGGGDTGSDCVGTSIRQKAKSVTQIELMPKPPEGRTDATAWPAHPGPAMLSTSTSQEEGCDRHWSILSKGFIKDDNGNLKGVKYVHIEWNGGKFTEIAGSEAVYEAELAFLAMGFLHPEHTGVVAELALDINQRGNVSADDNYMTSVDGVFVAGDMRTGQSLVVWCISDGRECAREVDKYLSGGITRLYSKNTAYCKLDK